MVIGVANSLKAGLAFRAIPDVLDSCEDVRSGETFAVYYV